jgi:hypothetical protein
MNGCCYVCGSPEIADGGAPGSPTCAGCKVARDHVVSMQTGAGGGSLAVCQCGWRSEVSRHNAYMIQDVKVRLHWRYMIRLAAEAAAA